MQRAERARSKACGHKNQENARPAEKTRQVDAHPALINQPAHHGRSGQPQNCAQRHGRRGALVKYRQQEKHALQTFARHRQKGHANQCPAMSVAAVERIAHRLLQMLLYRLGRLLHPQHHISEHRHGHQADHAHHKLLLLLRNFACFFINKPTGKQAHCRCQHYAEPHFRHHMPIAALLQKAGHNAHNQSRLDALAQHNQKSNQHRRPLLTKFISGRLYPCSRAKCKQFLIRLNEYLLIK